MNAKHISYLMLISLLMTAGCIGPNPLFPTTEEKLEKASLDKADVERYMEEETKQLVTGAKELIEHRSTQVDKLPVQDEIALDLVTQAERLLGGEPIEKIDIEQLMALHDADLDKYDDIIEEKENLVTILRKNEENYEARIEALQQQIQREESQKKGFWGWVKTFGFWGVLGLIVLLILSPKLFGIIVAKIPSLINLFGVTSVRVLNGIVKGVQEARLAVAELPDDKKLAKTEILDLIDDKLKIGADPETEETVKTLKTNMRLPSATKLIRKNVSGK